MKHQGHLPGQVEIEERIPLKQGLKQDETGVEIHGIRIIEERIPLKQGLKPSTKCSPALYIPY